MTIRKSQLVSPRPEAAPKNHPEKLLFVGFTLLQFIFLSFFQPQEQENIFSIKEERDKIFT